VAAWTKRRWLFALTLGLHTAIYLYLAAHTILWPPHTEPAPAVAEASE
jgi:hypothetical protein